MVTQMVHDSARPNEAIFLQMVTEMDRDSELRPALLIVAVLEFQLTEERRKKVATEAPTMASLIWDRTAIDDWQHLVRFERRDRLDSQPKTGPRDPLAQ